MTQGTLNQILQQLDTLELVELQQLHQTVQKYLDKKEGNVKQGAFHKALINSGLVKQVKHISYEPIAERTLIKIEGKPVSETIIEERR